MQAEIPKQDEASSRVQTEEKMARIDLAVPFSQKDEAKSLGARWDPSLKTWYVPDGMAVGPLARWLPVPDKSDLEHEPEFCVRSPYYYVVESVSDCWSCSNLTRVFSFKLPEDHEEFDYVYDEDEGFALTSNLGEWRCHEYRGTRHLASSSYRNLKAYKWAYTAGSYRGRQGRIARNKKARTGRASWGVS